MKLNLGMGALDDVRRRLILRFMVSMAMALFVAGGFCAGWFFVARTADRLHAMALFPAGPEAEQAIGADAPSVPGVSPTAQVGVPIRPPSDPRYAFLLLGYGGGAHGGAYLTDSMIVVIVDPAQKTLSLLSVPRDIWSPMIFNGQSVIYNKLNTGYAFAKDSSYHKDRLPKYKGDQGAGTLVMDTIARLTGIPISYYLALDFAGFRETIDLVGGIDVDVPVAFTSSYPANDNPEIDPSWTIVRFTKGMQHMNGERAIEYARAREVIDDVSEGSDFARSRRQRLIIEAFKTRMSQPGGLIRIPQLLVAATGHVDTNYSIPSAAQLAQLAADWQNVRFYQTSLTNQNYLTEATGPQGMYILVPATEDYSWASVRALGRRLWDNPETGMAMANTEIVIENDSGSPGLGGRLSTALTMLGYRVGVPTVGTTGTSSRVVDSTGGDSALVVHQLEGDLEAQLPITIAEGSAVKGKLVLQIGSDDAKLANLVVPPDPSAPSSATGLMRGGGWAPEYSAPEPAETPIRRTPIPTVRASTPQATTFPREVPPDGSLEVLPTATRSNQLPIPILTPGPAVGLTPTPARPAGATTSPPVHTALATATVGRR